MPENRNRGHAIKQLKKFISVETDPADREVQLEACRANTLIYIGDSLESIARSLEIEPVEHTDVKFGQEEQG